MLNNNHRRNNQLEVSKVVDLQGRKDVQEEKHLDKQQLLMQLRLLPQLQILRRRNLQLNMLLRPLMNLISVKK